MGIQDVSNRTSPDELRYFIRSLLKDLRALDKMIADGLIQSGVRRIGAEQEMVIINSAFRPAPIAQKILDRLADPHFTNEIALFNIELNLDPFTFGGDCLSSMERELDESIARARAVANSHDADIALTGILPTIRKSDLELDCMTPKPRYFALNDALKRLRGQSYELKIEGADALNISHDSWLLEACCTSFQIHFQVSASEFANHYNVAQAVTAPVVAAATNSPLLFGRKLWKETRVPLFEQSVDTRNASFHLRERSPRVSFGSRWVRESVLELYEEDIARFRVLLGARTEEDPFEMLSRGLTPQLSALRLYNSTVWRWNRACYGITEGKPHLRVEARAFPAGPTVLDEMANAAFFFGLMCGLSAEHEDISKVMQFDHAKANFLAASHLGLDAQFTWIGGKLIPAQELICHHLLPLARSGLESSNISHSDIDRYLGVIEERVTSKQTGAQWQLDSMAGLRIGATRDEALSCLTAAMIRNQQSGEPVHKWPLAGIADGVACKQCYLRVEEFMTTDLFTVHEDEPLDLVANLMDWKRVRHIPVEDEQGRLAGLISCFEVLRHLGKAVTEKTTEPVPVSSIMTCGPLTVTPETPTIEAIALMRKGRVDCLPVVTEGRLVGIVTERDFINVAARLLERNVDSICDNCLGKALAV